tara:strand:- start:153 stop:398 length:246 start_codon:yes stop_codon:yes gene_type:complete
MKAYLIRCFDAMSQLGNCILYPSTGTANHSISGDAWRFKRTKTMYVIDLIFSPFEGDHCKVSHEADVKRAARLLAETRHDA